MKKDINSAAEMLYAILSFVIAFPFLYLFILMGVLFEVSLVPADVLFDNTGRKSSWLSWAADRGGFFVWLGYVMIYFFSLCVVIWRYYKHQKVSFYPFIPVFYLSFWLFFVLLIMYVRLIGSNYG